MTNESDSQAAAAAFFRALFGTFLLICGSMFFININEDPQMFMILTVAFSAPGLYLLITGAVARGIVLSRT
jgi:hypothetical protein